MFRQDHAVCSDRTGKVSIKQKRVLEDYILNYKQKKSTHMMVLTWGTIISRTLKIESPKNIIFTDEWKKNNGRVLLKITI